MLWLGLFGTVPALAFQVLELPERFTRLDAQAALYWQVDTEDGLTLDAIRQLNDRFKPVERIQLPPEIGTVWTRLQLHNPHSDPQAVLLMHPSPYTNFIDIHVLRPDGGVQSFALGSHRPRHLRTLVYRYDVEPLLIQPGEHLSIYTRYASLNPLQINTWVFSPDGFLHFAINDALIWGVFTGLIGALVLYNLVAGFSLRQGVFLLYVVHALVLFAFTLTMQGGLILLGLTALVTAVMPEEVPWLLTLYGPTEARISRILLLLVTITAALFTIAFFNLVAYARWLTQLLYLWIGVALVLCLSEIMAVFIPGLYGVSFVILYAASVFLLLWFAIAVYASVRRLPGWGYYLAGSGSFILLAWMQNAEWLGIDPGLPQMIKVYGTPIGLMLELGFYSLALGQRIRQVAGAKETSERLLLEHSKFLSVGQMLSGVVHQLKRPIIHASNRLMKLEALLDASAAEREAALPHTLRELRQSIDFMDQTIVNVYRFYTEDHDPVRFKPAEHIEQVITLLTPMTMGSSLRIERQLLPSLELHSYPQAFAHAILIVMENAVEALRTRAVPDPCIWIAMQCTATSLVVSVTDNAGGIRIQPIERMFDPLTRPSGGFGLGIGLGLARRLIEGRLGGQIRAQNLALGAQLTIKLPLVSEPPST